MKRSLYCILIFAVFLAVIPLFAACEEDSTEAPIYEELVPAFTYAGTTVPLETDNGWCLTRFKDRIALTNIGERKQYLLTWQGSNATGIMENASLTLKTAVSLKKTALDNLEIEQVNGLFLRYTFRGDDGLDGTLICSISE